MVTYRESTSMLATHIVYVALYCDNSLYWAIHIVYLGFPNWLITLGDECNDTSTSLYGSPGWLELAIPMGFIVLF